MPEPTTRRDRLRAATAAEILGAARRQLVEGGARAVTLRAIARDVGMTAPGLYRYFASLDELVAALVQDVAAELTGELLRAGAAAGADVGGDVAPDVARDVAGHVVTGAVDPARAGTGDVARAVPGPAEVPATGGAHAAASDRPAGTAADVERTVTGAADEVARTVTRAGRDGARAVPLPNAPTASPDEGGARRAGERALAVCRTFRRWAVEHPAEFGLLFGTPGPGPVAAAGHHLEGVLAGLFSELWERYRFPVPEDAEPDLTAQLAAWRAHTGSLVPIGAIRVLLGYWVRLYGLVALEVFGHLRFAIADAEPLFEETLREFAGALGAGDVYRRPG